MKRLLVILLLLLAHSGASADFSRSQVLLHPQLPVTNPFIIEISGTWPNDCHPGEQKPVVDSWDGQTVIVDFEIIVEHVTCNDVDTPYRALVDMSDAIRTTKPVGDTLDLQIHFREESWEQTVDLVCPDGGTCPESAQGLEWADPGIYFVAGQPNQGLLVARQNAATAIYPLVYDESGSSEWLFTGNLMLEDTFFSPILRFSSGDCFDCEPTGAVPDVTPIGYLSVLADRPGVLQVKVNEGLFSEYHSVVYGYTTFAVGPEGSQTLVDLEGRWGLRENHGTNPPLSDLTELLPGVFDVELEKVLTADPGTQQDGLVSYLVSDPTGNTLGQLFCQGQTATDGVTGLCEFIDETDVAEPLFWFHQLGPSTLGIEYGRPLDDVGVAPGGQAVRLD